MEETRESIEYVFDSLEAVPYVEEVIRELHLGACKYWSRPVTREDWFATGDLVITKQLPILLEEYDLNYDIPINKDNKYLVGFAEYLIDSMLAYIGYLEGCLKQKIDNKKEDTE